MYDYSSTSIKQIPALIKKVKWDKNTKNLDIGGGKFDLATAYLHEQGVHNFVLDPYFRRIEENNTTIYSRPFDSCTILNVLNVIPYSRTRIFVLLIAKEMVKRNGKIFISVHEGNKTNACRVSKKNTWQSNSHIEKYISEIRVIFPECKLKTIRGFKYVEITNV